jgi:hypothetical protein
MISSRHITGATSTTMPVSSSPDSSAYFMQILRSCRMMTVGCFFSPPWMVISLQLILISSARSLGYLCFSSWPARVMRWSCLRLWMISESSFRLCLRVRSVPPPSGLVPYLPHILAKIVQHNIWPVVRRSDLILKMAQFVYAISLRLPFCLCKHILSVMLEARDESNTSLPYGCLLTQIILQSGISVTGEPKMKI